jgi:hypothetical protein
MQDVARGWENIYMASVLLNPTLIRAGKNYD